MQRPKLHLAEDLLNRFRSKEDLYRSMIQQGNARNFIST